MSNPCFTTLKYTIALWTLLYSAVAAAAEPQLTAVPHELKGVPGEPLQVELTIETDRAVPVQLKIPSISNLVVRAVEKVPIQRTENGRYLRKRILIWQGTESGRVSLTNLTVAVNAEEFVFPTIRIEITEIEPAKPPPEPTAEEAE